MNSKQTFLFLSALGLALLVTGCQGCDANRADAPATSTAPHGEAEAAPGPEVTYEPAYPAEVSEEGLTEEDTAQQRATHDHGDGEHAHGEGEDHAHGDEEHPHGEGEDHTHGEAGDHDHGDEEHASGGTP